MSEAALAPAHGGGIGVQVRQVARPDVLEQGFKVCGQRLAKITLQFIEPGVPQTIQPVENRRCPLPQYPLRHGV